MTVTSTTELDELLSEGVEGALERERTEFDRLAGPFATSIVLFGARKLGRRALAGLRRLGVEPLAFSDNNESLWGQSIDGLQVFSPLDAARLFGGSAVFVITIWGRGSADPMRERAARLFQLGCQRVVSFGPLLWKYPGAFLPLTGTNLPHKILEDAELVRAAFSVLADDRSRAEFLAQLRWRLLFDFDALPDPLGDQIYFPQQLVQLRSDETFVDCGAFDGDTILTFLSLCDSRFRQIVAFEPDAINLERLHRTVESLPAKVQERTRVMEAAVGAGRGKIRFEPTGGPGSTEAENGDEVDCLTLDEALADDIPTYIKMDIEGAEPAALRGSAELLAKHAPVLAICSYHLQDHLWEIPATIHHLNPDYRIYLRPHIQMVEDLVCYAIPPGRLALLKDAVKR